MTTLQSRAVRAIAASAILCVTMFGVLSAARAAPIITPTVLNPGDQYRLAFVTSTTTNALSSDIAYYNNFVNTLGLAATGINGWKAIVSTTSVDARDNTETGPNPNFDDAPIYLLNGFSKVADNNADLWDASLDTPIHLTEQGIYRAELVWTGSTHQGVSDFPVGATISAMQGDSGYQTSAWVDLAPERSINVRSLYALSGVLTVGNPPASVSSPGTVLILFAGIAGLFRMRNAISALGQRQA
jgi:hypothetical protein